MAKKFSEQLVKLRTEQGLSQQQLAMKLFVNRSTIARWENGSRVPDLMLLRRLADCLNVKITDLLPNDPGSETSPVVLMIDDEDIVLAGGLKVLFEALPEAEIVGFSRPSEALEFARSNNVRLAFVDIELGTQSGLTLCEKLLEINPTTNVVFLTAFPDYSLKAWNTGASGFLIKPLTPEAVKKQLSRLRHPF
ncbi:MAG: response regulator [Oscillospiraceae bacterium]|nr:response regulator [Oscillospiraceae bacterium]